MRGWSIFAAIVLAVVILGAMLLGTARAETIHVDAGHNWWTPVYEAKDGDVIVFAPGTYENMDWYNPAPHEVPITLQGGPGVTAPFIRIQNAKGWIYDGWTITSGNSPDVGLSISGSTNIVIDHFHITAAPGGVSGLGANIRNNANVTVKNSQFDHRGSGIGSADNVGLTIDGNSFHDLNTDGIIACGETDLTVNNNDLKDFHPHEGDHPDAIQWCSSAYHEPVNLTITGNRIERGNGAVIQGIFGEQGDGVVVSRNAMLGTMYNGYSWCDAHGITFDTNFAQPWTDMWTKAIVRCGSSDFTARDNTVPELSNYTESDGTPNTGYWHESGTIIIGAAPVGDRSAYTAWIAAHQGKPPTPQPPDELAKLKAENAALRRIVDADSFAFAEIRGVLEQVRPVAARPVRHGPLRAPPTWLHGAVKGAKKTAH
jgi:hypothetical protein